MAVSALTVLLSNTLEESQFVAAPAQRKRLILEGPLAALQGPDDSEDEAAGGRRGMACTMHLAGPLLLEPLLLAGPLLLDLSGLVTRAQCKPPAFGWLAALSKLPVAPAPRRHTLQTHWQPRWMLSSTHTCKRWMGRRMPSSPAASACCRGWGRLRAWWVGGGAAGGVAVITE